MKSFLTEASLLQRQLHNNINGKKIVSKKFEKVLIQNTK